jgi:hypothetical protein
MSVRELTNADLILKKACRRIYIIANSKPFIENNWQTPFIEASGGNIYL